VIDVMKRPKKTVSVVMPVELYDLLAEKAEETNRTIPGYIRQVLKGREPPLDWPIGGIPPMEEPQQGP